MTYYTTENDARNEILDRPHLKTGETRCKCGDISCYYEYNPQSIHPDKVIICDQCYLDCANFERI
jgi:hypothetical protein